MTLTAIREARQLRQPYALKRRGFVFLRLINRQVFNR